jgi:hypothetical protein
MSNYHEPIRLEKLSGIPMTKLEIEVDGCRLMTKTLSTPCQANKGAKDWSPLDESRIRNWRNEKFADVQVCGSSWNGAGVMALVQVGNIHPKISRTAAEEPLLTASNILNFPFSNSA